MYYPYDLADPSRASFLLLMVVVFLFRGDSIVCFSMHKATTVRDTGIVPTMVLVAMDKKLLHRKITASYFGKKNSVRSP